MRDLLNIAVIILKLKHFSIIIAIFCSLADWVVVDMVVPKTLTLKHVPKTVSFKQKCLICDFHDHHVLNYI